MEMEPLDSNYVEQKIGWTFIDNSEGDIFIVNVKIYAIGKWVINEEGKWHIEIEEIRIISEHPEEDVKRVKRLVGDHLEEIIDHIEEENNPPTSF